MAEGVIPNLGHPAAHFWIPMQAATVESGCMWFIPRSHLGNLRMHHPVANDPGNHTLETDEIEAENRQVPCAVPAGGCSIHGPKTMHYTGPNETDQARRAWILIFGLPD
jgi:ectoine hydroxylase-related dioxygenase (phytanoyl-CoA dioxygenase family)